MSAPKCPLCGANHWQREPHIWSDDPKPPTKEPKKPVEVPEPIKAVIVESDSERCTQAEYNRRWREKNKERYREYMREYMKNKRAHR